MTFFVPTKFVWRFGGSQVHLCGSFTRWVETVPMAPVEGQPGVFSVVVHLPPGYHQYKFIVDGEWRHDETQPFMPDPLGNVNNWLFVRKPEGTAGAPSVQPTAVSGPPVSQAQPATSQTSETVPTASPKVSPETPTNAGSPAAASPMAQQQQQPIPEARSVAGSEPTPSVRSEAEPEHTCRSIQDFLAAHTAYELIPESGKVVLMDVDLPMRQALHALHEQGIASAPLWDPECGSVVGVISASDFIFMLQRLRLLVRNSSTALSEQEMDDYTIRVVRDELAAESQTPRPLVYVCVTDTLARVVETIVRARCHTIPVLTCPLGDDDGARDESSVPEVVHSASLAGVLACLLRHFRASAPSLPLLSRPLRQLPVGTWDARGSLAAQNDGRRVVDLACVEPTAPLSTALRLLVETGVSCLPVVDDARTLLDVYARADICMLAKGNAYSRLQAEDVTVGQALTLASAPLGAPAAGGGWGAAGAAGAGGAKQRVWICTADDTLRTIVERLAVPGVRRLVVVEASTHRVEGIVSLSDVAAFLMQPLG